ncbi:MAG TPA: hypothetical protein VFS15_03875 [Kofleriaceae bacterium]|nr:hypothetical protein [Kofleriaceae bacterium]
MKGDIAFAGFMLTADEWQELDAESRAQLIAVATRKIEPLPEPRRRLAEGTGPHEVLELLDAELDELLELDEPIDPPNANDSDAAGDYEDFSDWGDL